MATCANCQAESPDGTTFCPSCGNALTGTPTATPVKPAAPQIKFDSSVLSQTDRIVGIASGVLFISMFLPWFSVNLGIGTFSADGLRSHGYLYIPLLLSIAIVAFLAAAALGLWKLPANSAVGHDQLLLIATAISFVLVVLGFVLKPGGSGVGWSFGAFVGLVAAAAAVAPLGLPVLRARRSK